MSGANKEALGRRRSRITSLATIVISLIIALLMVYPIIYSALSGLKTLREFQLYPSYALPKSFNLDNYRYVLAESDMPRYFINSIAIMAIVVIAVLWLSATAGFAIERMRFRGRRQMMVYFLIGLMIPMQVCLAPLYLTFSRLNWTDSFIGVIIPQVAFGLPLSIYLFANFYRFLPGDILEASVIDGCSAMQMFLRIVLPLSRNTVMTLAIMRAVFSWNDFIFAYTFTKSKRMQTVTLGLRDFVGAYGYTDWGRTFATITITILPTLLIYFLLGKYMVAGLTGGAIKE